MIPPLPSQIGINIHLAGIRHFGLDERKTIHTLFSFPYHHVRIPIPLDEVSPKKGVWDFAARDALLDKATQHKKSIHLQFGAKTIGWPEVWLPTWLLEKYPYLDTPFCKIDKEKEVQEFLLEAIERCAKRYGTLSNLVSIQIENEAFCKRLSVSNYRYVSFTFHKKEVAIVKNNSKSSVLILQNLPLNNFFDTFQAFPYVFKESDVIGLNIYNQHLPQKTSQYINNLFLSTTMKSMKPLAWFMKKHIYITELQTAAWLTGQKTPIKPFSLTLFERTLHHYLSLGAEIIFLWDVEQIIWKNDKKHLAVLSSLDA